MHRMTIAKRVILLVAVPLLALVALGVWTRIELGRIERATRFVASLPRRLGLRLPR